MYPIRDKHRRKRTARRGAAMVEMAIILMVFLTLVLGMLDLGIAVLRSHVLANAAREGARRAVVHGGMAPQEWGPTAVSESASTGTHPIVAVIEPFLVGLDLSEVTISVTWPEGSNGLEKLVTVTVSTDYHPVMTFIFGNPTFTLSGSSTMQILY